MVQPRSLLPRAAVAVSPSIASTTSGASRGVTQRRRERLVRALAMRLRTVYESAANDLELWSKSATAQLDAQLRERRRSFSRRIEAVDRIQQAASGLVERISEIEANEEELGQLERRLQELTAQLIALPGVNAVTTGGDPLPA